MRPAGIFVAKANDVGLPRMILLAHVFPGIHGRSARMIVAKCLLDFIGGETRADFGR
jgi:hypothetical protein